MKFKKYIMITAAAFSLISFNAAAQDSTDPEMQYPRYIVKYKDGTKAKLTTKFDASPSKLSLQIDTRNAFAARLSPELLEELESDPDVEYVEIDQPRYLMSSGELTPYGINMVQAPLVSDENAGDITVCVMDSGFDIQHVDLQSVRVTGDDSHPGGSFDTGDWFNDGFGHGTHVAGTIAALGGNNEGVTSILPNDKLNLHIVKVFSDEGEWGYSFPPDCSTGNSNDDPPSVVEPAPIGGSCIFSSNIWVAVDQCVAAGATVINMSLGGTFPSLLEDEAFEEAYANGVLHIASAGNSGVEGFRYPAAYDSVIAIAAVDNSMTRASFSTKNTQVELAAPGVNVMSTLPGNRYQAYSGTSMSAPHVTGVAALLWSNYPNCSNQQIRDAMNATALDRGLDGRDIEYGYGIVQAKAAYDYLENVCPEVNEPPVSSFTYSCDGLTCSFDGTSSTDSDGQIVSHYWKVKTGVAVGGATPTYTYSEPGRYYVGLTVKDDDGARGGSRQYVTVEDPDAPNKAPVSDFAYSCDGLTCEFDGSLSADEDGEIVSYYWAYEPGERGSGVTSTHTYSAPGKYFVGLSVKDNLNVKGGSRQYVTVE